MTQKQSFRSRWILAAAVAAVPVLGVASSASAQFRQNNQGQALDANPRVGSQGSNSDGGGRSNRGSTVTGNQIVNRNVTAGREFRDIVPYTDARAFRGVTTGLESDRFVRNSVGAPTRTTPLGDNSQPQPFYGDARAVAPPAGAVRLGPSGGYTTAQPGTVTRDQIENNPYPFNTFGSSLTGDQTPQLGTSLMRGPALDRQGGQGSIVAASPLSGIQQLTPQEAQQQYLQRILGDTRGVDRFSDDLRGKSIRDLQDELLQSLQPTPAGAQPPQPARQSDPSAPAGQGQGQGQGQGTDTTPGAAQPVQPGTPLPPIGRPGASPAPLGQPLSPRETPSDPSLRSELRGTAIGSGQMGAGVGTGESTRRQVMIPPPEQQSAMYRQMRERFQAQRPGGAVSDQEAQRQFEQELRAVTPPAPGAAQPAPGAPGAPRAPGAAAPGAAAPGTGARPLPAGRTPAVGGAPAPRIPGAAAPGATTQPAAPRPGTGGPAAPGAPRANLGKPVQVTSLADGVRAPGLGQLLRSAEQLMQQKKFGEALAAYDSAAQVAPNNPLIAVGTAHAEIGAATYRNAEAHLRDAFVRDPALMHAQYDLKKFLGQDHLQVVINDLKDIAKREPNFATPAFLLAYISYNTGNEAQAVTYLAEVEKRLGRPDAVVKLLRANWTLPAAAPEANK